MSDELGGVRITNREIYDGLLAVQRAVEHLSGQVATGLASEADHESRLRVLEVNQAYPKHVEDQERRIRFLEKAAWGIPPSFVLGALALLVKVGG